MGLRMFYLQWKVSPEKKGACGKNGLSNPTAPVKTYLLMPPNYSDTLQLLGIRIHQLFWVSLDWESHFSSPFPVFPGGLQERPRSRRYIKQKVSGSLLGHLLDLPSCWEPLMHVHLLMDFLSCSLGPYTGWGQNHSFIWSLVQHPWAPQTIQKLTAAFERPLNVTSGFQWIPEGRLKGLLKAAANLWRACWHCTLAAWSSRVPWRAGTTKTQTHVVPWKPFPAQ